MSAPRIPERDEPRAGFVGVDPGLLEDAVTAIDAGAFRSAARLYGDRLRAGVTAAVEEAIAGMADLSLADLNRVAQAAERELADRRLAELWRSPFPGEVYRWGLRMLPTPLVPRNVITVLGGAAGVHLYNPADEHGDPSRVELALNPSPGWSRWTAGAREARRDRRRRDR